MSFPDLGGLANDLVATGIISAAGAPIATIGTIVSQSLPVIGPVQTYNFQSTGAAQAATIKATPGNYYGAQVTAVIGAGTLLVINAGAAAATGSILGLVVGTVYSPVGNAMLGGGLGTPYSTLYATVVGTVNANIYYT
jgi:hypothetical protein